MSSFEFDNIFDVDYVVRSKKSRKTKGDSSSKVPRSTSILTAVIQKIKRLELKVERVEESLVNWSSHTQLFTPQIGE